MPTNEPRAQAAGIALETYRGEGQQTTQEAMTDLLTDFMQAGEDRFYRSAGHGQNSF